MADKNDKVLVYYLGYPGVNDVVCTMVGNEPYGSPVKGDGSPDIGAPIEVRQGDLKIFLSKSLYFDKDANMLKCAYTQDATMAALVKSGGKIGAAATLTADNLLGMLTPDQLRERLALIEADSKADSDLPATPNSKVKK